jgi:hypothetical protein
MKLTLVAAQMLLIGASSSSATKWVSCDDCLSTKDIELANKLNELYSATFQSIESERLTVFSQIEKDIPEFV